MKKTSILLVYLLLSFIFLISACKKEPVPTGLLYGKIYFQGTTVAVADFTLSIADQREQSSDIGYFRIDDIPLGEHLFLADKKGFTPWQQTVTISKTATEIIIFAESDDFTSSVFGTALGKDSKSAQEGLLVIMLNPNGTESQLQAITDENGDFEIKGIPQGERTIILKSGSTELLRAIINLESWDYALAFAAPETGVEIEFTDARDGNVYHYVNLGNQSWMTENLKYLPVVHSPVEESNTDPMYYVYWYWGNNVAEAKDSMYYDLYGVAYNFPAAKSACPEGWHLPTDAEWNELQIFLGMNPSENDVLGYQTSGNVGYKMKSTSGWENCWNGHDYQGDNGDNSSLLNMRPAGGKMNYTSFYIPMTAGFSTATAFDETCYWIRSLSPVETSVYRVYIINLYGHFIRCVKDAD